MREGWEKPIPSFAWARQEVSASANLQKVVMWYDQVGLLGGFFPPLPPSSEKLVPGMSWTWNFVLNSGTFEPYQSSDFGDCVASIQYTIGYQLRWYADLDAPVVRDHRH